MDRLAKCRRVEAAGLRVLPYEFGTAEEIALDPPVVSKPRDEFVSGGHEFAVVFAGEIDCNPVVSLDGVGDAVAGVEPGRITYFQTDIL